MKYEKMVLSPIKTVIEHLSIYEKMHAVYESGREMAILWIWNSTCRQTRGTSLISDSEQVFLSNFIPKALKYYFNA